jgi:KUP system potassium uptake protein
VPEAAYWPMLLLACMATVIASQAVISGAFSMTQHAVQMGILPRMNILRTSETQEGQIYVPQMNWLLMIGVIALVVTFQNSGNLTSAYGIAVTGTMLISSIMAYIVIRRLWGWSRLQTLALLIPLGFIELIFLASNLTKLFYGAWMPLLLGLALITVMLTWTKGSRIVAEKTRRDSLPMTEVAAMLETRPPLRIPGTAIFLTADGSVAPTSLMHNLKHNKVLHENNIILSIRIASLPHAEEDERVSIEAINADFTRIILTFGFMDTPNVPRALAGCRKLGVRFDAMTTTFFLGRRTLLASAHSGLPLWRAYLYIALMKNATDPSEFFRLPPGRVVEMGTQMRV